MKTALADTSVTFEQLTDLGVDSPTLIEGFPGFGLVAAIAVDQITNQLELEHHGNIVSEAFPPVLSYHDGLARDLVRVYADRDHGVMTLRSDIALPRSSFAGLSRCVREELAANFDRAIFLAGAPAETREDIGTVTAVTTSPELERDVKDAGIELADGIGLVGGITGALATDCYHHDVPAVVLIVHADPFLPDPAAAQSVIEDALEPLVSFDIDTTPLAEQSKQIQQQMQQIAAQYQQTVAQDQQPPADAPLGMYQ